MATIALSFVGSVVGGPIGGAIGGMIGAYIDSQFLFASKTKVRGPRIDDVPITAAAEGAPIPRIMGGAMRSGSILIDAGKVIEVQSTESSGGKGGGSSVETTTYSYYQDCAYLIARGPVQDFRRIWLDDILIRDTDPLNTITLTWAALQGRSGIVWDGWPAWGGAFPPGTAASLVGGEAQDLVGRKFRHNGEWDAVVAEITAWAPGMPDSLPSLGYTEIWRFEEGDPDDSGDLSIIMSYGTTLGPPPIETLADEVRIYLGSADQEPDGTLEAIADDGIAPAYRGVAYVVLERLALEKFSNRLPSLTAEIVGETGTETVSGALDALLEDAGIEVDRRRVDSFGGHLLAGAVIPPGSVQDAVTGLMSIVDGTIRQRAGVIEIIPRERDNPRGLDPAWLGASAGGKVTRWSPLRVADETGLAGSVTVEYADASKSYERGSQTVRRSNAVVTRSRVDQSISMDAICLTDDDAAAIASRALWRQWIERESGAIYLPPAYLDLESADWLTLPWGDEVYTLRITRRSRKSDTTVELECAVVSAVPDPQAGAAGRGRTPTGYVPPIVSITLIEIAPLRSDQVSDPGYIVALRPLARADAWAGATLLRATSEGGAPDTLASVPFEASIGYTLTGLGSAPPHLWDHGNTLDVRFDRGAGPSSIPEAEVRAGGNYMLLDGEILAFRDAVLIEPRVWRLSHFRRGLRGTKPESHIAGRSAILLDATVGFVPIERYEIGRSVWLRALPSGGVIDDTVEITFRPAAGNLKPLSPCHLAAAPAGGDIAVSWTRRDRALWRTLAGDPPLSEATESYRVRVVIAGTTVRTVTVAAPSWVWTAAMRAADIAAAGSGRLMISQLSAVVGPGAEARLDFVITDDGLGGFVVTFEG